MSAHFLPPLQRERERSFKGVDTGKSISQRETHTERGKDHHSVGTTSSLRDLDAFVVVDIHCGIRADWANGRLLFVVVIVDRRCLLLLLSLPLQDHRWTRPLEGRCGTDVAGSYAAAGMLVSSAAAERSAAAARTAVGRCCASVDALPPELEELSSSGVGPEPPGRPGAIAVAAATVVVSGGGLRGGHPVSAATGSSHRGGVVAVVGGGVGC